MPAFQSARSLSWVCTCSGSFVIRAQAALTRDIQETMRAWAPQLQQCALIFVHAPSANAAPLFHGEAPPLGRGDPRVRSVPFTTRRPTFSETKRVAQTLLTVTACEAPAALPPPPPGLSSHFCHVAAPCFWPDLLSAQSSLLRVIGLATIVVTGCCRHAETGKKKHAPQPKAQQEYRGTESASASQPAEPEVPDSALHAASRSGDADAVERLSSL